MSFFFKRGVARDNPLASVHKDASVKISSGRLALAKRSSRYMQLIASLDAKKMTDVREWESLMDDLRDEFGTAGVASLPLGIVSKCFLGSPYEVHILDLSSRQIVQHYKTTEPLPGEFERARGLALHNAYALIEVYTDKLVLIKEDGSTVSV